MPIWRKVEKPHSFVILIGLKGIKNFFKNPLGTFLLPIHVLPNCKVSEKVMNSFRENECDSLGIFSAKRRETKNLIFEISNGD